MNQVIFLFEQWTKCKVHGSYINQQGKWGTDENKKKYRMDQKDKVSKVFMISLLSVSGGFGNEEKHLRSLLSC